MNKRLISLLLAVSAAFSLLCCAFAEPVSDGSAETAPVLTRTVKIVGAEDLLRLAESCRLDSFSRGLEVFLEADIDLTGADFESIPIFCGTFRGNNHTIEGLNVSDEGSVQGLFRCLSKTAVVENLKVNGSVSPAGSRSLVGGIAGENRGTLINCSFSGTVSGGDRVGGICGRNGVSGMIENCRVAGTVYGEHFVGGIAGENAGVIRSCSSRSAVNTSPQQNAVELTEITIESLTDSEAVDTVTDIGGIAGENTGVIRSCINRGSVGYRHMGYNIGGIAGTQSGSILSCTNAGSVQGRKEVGGIVGQMEPTARIVFSEDTLQILERQLSGLSGTVSSAVTNVQTGAQEVESEVYRLQDHLEKATDAAGTLVQEVADYTQELAEMNSSFGDGGIVYPDYPDYPTGPDYGSGRPVLPSLPGIDGGAMIRPDTDRITAAANGLSSSVSRMTSALWNINETSQSAFGSLSNDLYRIQDQMTAMRVTLGNAAETTGGSIKDVSDGDTADDLTGKVFDCINTGEVLADLNAGGIAGAMAMENDLDPEEDWTVSGENSLHFESELRAVILSCRNEGSVTVRRQNGGGIVGWQSMGLVKECFNTASLDCTGAEQIGGIAGQSDGYLRMNGAKCRITAAKSAGGIAGSASVVSDCRSIVEFGEAKEKTGAVLGELQEPENREDLSGNYYLVNGVDYGAFDGISLDGMGQSLSQLAFFALDGVPEEMRTVTVRFVYESGQQRRLVLEPGDDLLRGRIPVIPQRAGFTAYWAGLDEAQLTDLVFDQTFHAAYAPFESVLQSELTRGTDQKPVLLAEGEFSPKAQLIVAAAEKAPAPERGDTLLESWSIRVSEGEKVSRARLIMPQSTEKEKLTVLLCGEDGRWTKTAYTVSGSYLIFPWNGESLSVAVIAEKELPLLAIAIGAAALLLIFAAVALRRKKRKK